MNQGRVFKISPTQIDLIEIVPDGREGYVEDRVPRFNWSGIVRLGNNKKTVKKFFIWETKTMNHAFRQFSMEL